VVVVNDLAVEVDDGDGLGSDGDESGDVLVGLVFG